VWRGGLRSPGVGWLRIVSWIKLGQFDHSPAETSKIDIRAGTYFKLSAGMTGLLANSVLSRSAHGNSIW
jgi:hypothetical protein